MKYILKFMFSILIILATFFVLNEKSIADDCTDENTDPTWDCADWTYDVEETIQFPGYNCDVTVVYDERVCLEDNPEECFFEEKKIKQVRVKSITWDWTLCHALTQYVMPGYPDDFVFMDNRVAGLIQDATGILSESWFEDYYNNDLTQLEKQYVECGGTAPDNCQAPTLPCQPFQTQSIRSQCMAMCVTKDRDDTNRLVFGVAPCLTDPYVCCVTERYYCACVDPNDPNNVDFIKYEEKTFGSGTCDNSVPPGNFCGEGPYKVVGTDSCSTYCTD